MPVGTLTRGTTNPNRLRRFDRWIVHRAGAALRRADHPVVVDLGYGRSPVTTLELADRLTGRIGPGIRVVGVEIDPERVAAAQPVTRPGVQFRRGGFEVPTPGQCAPLVIRAANVLRQYDEDQVGAAWARMAGRLAPGGIVVEGTCDELGRLAAWVTIGAPAARIPGGPAGPAASAAPSPPAAGGRAAVVPESLTIGVQLRSLERPSQVAQRLPKALIHRNVPGEPVHALLVALDLAWARASAHGVFGPRQRWLAAVELLRADGWPVLDGPSRWRLGELTVPWQCVAPSPEERSPAARTG